MRHTTRLILALAAAMLAEGCATTPPATLRAEQSTADTQTAQLAAYRETRPAAALAFAGTLPSEYPLAGLDRDARQPSAFFGYESTITESYVLYTDDDQHHYGGYGGGGGSGHGGWCGYGGGWGDDYERRAISVKTGVVER